MSHDIQVLNLHVNGPGRQDLWSIGFKVLGLTLSMTWFKPGSTHPFHVLTVKA